MTTLRVIAFVINILIALWLIRATMVSDFAIDFVRRRSWSERDGMDIYTGLPRRKMIFSFWIWDLRRFIEED